MKPPESRLSDAELVRLCLDGRSEAFGGIIERYYDPIFSYIHLHTRDYHVSENLSQEVFLLAYTSLHRCKDTQRFAGWLFGIAQNLCKRWYRLFKREKPPYQGPRTYPPPNQQLERQELMEILQQAIQNLPEDSKTIIVLRHQQGLKCREIAARLGIPLGTVTSTLARAHATLKSYILKKTGGEI